MSATLNFQGQIVITDLNGGQRVINLNTPTAAYTADSMQTFTVSAGGTAVLWDITGSAPVSVSVWTAMFLLPSINLDLSMGVMAGAGTAVWNSIPLKANQVFPLFRNSFYYNYVNGASTDIFAGTASGTCKYLKVKEPTGTTAGNVQLFMCS